MAGRSSRSLSEDTLDLGATEKGVTSPRVKCPELLIETLLAPARKYILYCLALGGARVQLLQNYQVNFAFLEALFTAIIEQALPGRCNSTGKATLQKTTSFPPFTWEEVSFSIPGKCTVGVRLLHSARRSAGQDQRRLWQ